MPDPRVAKGSLPRVSAEFYSAAGVLTDPTTLYLYVKEPDGIITQYTYLVDLIIVRDAAGQYHADVPVDKNGIWRFKWQALDALGVNTAASESLIYVYSHYDNTEG